jgi:hypothetical protein
MRREAVEMAKKTFYAVPFMEKYVPNPSLFMQTVCLVHTQAFC